MAALLRERILASFTSDELFALCVDHFPTVAREFTTGMTSSQRVHLLLSHCARNQHGELLLDLLEHARPGQFTAARTALLAELANATNVPDPSTTTITVGGDYAEGDIDKRQGVFLTNTTVVNSTIIGVQNIIQPLPPPSPRHQLRAPVPDFVGRAEEIAAIVEALQPAAGGGAMAISGLRGMGGIGKTELAFAAAQRLAPSFPDAQIVLALRGASATPLSPEQALARVVQVFHPEAKLPDDLEQLKGIYASCLHSQRVLILADDARDAAQVRPLLPPPGCALLITSRQHFTLPGMRARNLDTLPPEDATVLLLAIHPSIGAHAAELAELCGYLPLALRVSAGLLANSTRTAARFLEQLRAERLKHLEDPDDPQASVAASLQLSWDALDALQQTALAQLAVFPASFDRAAALAVLDAGDDGEALLDALVRRSLLEWDTASERYDLHDLVRVFAAAQLADEDAVRLRHARHYVVVASEAQNAYLQGDDALMGGLALFDRERVQIDAGWRWVMEHIGKVEIDQVLSEYAHATAYLGDLRYDTRGERIPQIEAALAAARRLSNPSVEAALLGNLGLAHYVLRDIRQAIEYYKQGLTIAHEIGDRQKAGAALGNMGLAYAALGEMRQALEYHEQALVISREFNDRRGEGLDLNNLGLVHFSLGWLQQAIEHFEKSLVISREIGDRRSEGNALGNLGLAYNSLGDTRRAIEYHNWNLVVAREIGARRAEGNALCNLGSSYLMIGEFDRALGLFGEQHIITKDVGDLNGELRALWGLARVAEELDNLASAITAYESALAIAQTIDDRAAEVAMSWNLGVLAEREGDLAHAAELMQRCVDYYRELGHPEAEQHATHVEALRQRLAAGQGQSTDAS